MEIINKRVDVDMCKLVKKGKGYHGLIRWDC
jgi:hypothetical protein